jgi:hypothetical protein
MSGSFHVDKRQKTIINEDNIGSGKAIAVTRGLVTTTLPPNEINLTEIIHTISQQMKHIDERLERLDKNQKEIMEQIGVLGDKID